MAENNHIEEKQANGRAVPSRLRRITGWTIRIMGSVLMVAWAIWYMDLQVFSETITKPSWTPLVGMALVLLATFVVSGVKLWLLLRSFAPVSLSVYMAHFFFAGSVGMLAISWLGDLILLGLLKRENIPLHQGLSAVLVDRIITLASCLFLFTPISLYYLLAIDLPLLLGGNVLLMTLFFLFLTSWNRLSPGLTRRFPSVHRFTVAFAEFFSLHRKVVVYNGVLSVLRGGLAGLGLFLAFEGAREPATFLPTIAIANVLSIITHLPVSLGGIGIYEGGGILVFEQLGLAREGVFAALVYQRTYYIVSSLILVGIMALYFQGKGWRFSQNDSEKEASVSNTG